MVDFKQGESQHAIFQAMVHNSGTVCEGSFPIERLQGTESLALAWLDHAIEQRFDVGFCQIGKS